MITFNTVLVKGNDPKYGFVAALCVESDGKVFNSGSCWSGGLVHNHLKQLNLEKKKSCTRIDYTLREA